MKVERLHEITGLFKNCTVEVTLTGFGVFDSKKRFVGEIRIAEPEGMTVREGYEHAGRVKEKLLDAGIDFWSDEVLEAGKLREFGGDR